MIGRITFSRYLRKGRSALLQARIEANGRQAALIVCAGRHVTTRGFWLMVQELIGYAEAGRWPVENA